MNTTIAYETEDDRWTAVQARDTAADGHFVYAVRTTGVYCQPSSTARLPKRENVEFFDSADAAEAAGYRCSRRARADQTSAAAERAALVARACRLIEASETPPQLDDLAIEVGMSPFHFHRLFKAETGLTPKAYSSAYRARKLREELSSPDASITNAIYDAGFNSNSRFYEVQKYITLTGHFFTPIGRMPSSNTGRHSNLAGTTMRCSLPRCCRRFPAMHSCLPLLVSIYKRNRC